MSPEHLFDGERCIHCGVNIYDWDGEEPCIEHDPVTYTTESGGAK